MSTAAQDSESSSPVSPSGLAASNWAHPGNPASGSDEAPSSSDSKEGHTLAECVSRLGDLLDGANAELHATKNHLADKELQLQTTQNSLQALKDKVKILKSEVQGERLITEALLATKTEQHEAVKEELESVKEELRVEREEHQKTRGQVTTANAERDIMQRLLGASSGRHQQQQEDHRQIAVLKEKLKGANQMVKMLRQSEGKWQTQLQLAQRNEEQMQKQLLLAQKQLLLAQKQLLLAQKQLLLAQSNLHSSMALHHKFADVALMCAGNINFAKYSATKRLRAEASLQMAALMPLEENEELPSIKVDYIVGDTSEAVQQLAADRNLQLVPGSTVIPVASEEEATGIKQLISNRGNTVLQKRSRDWENCTHANLGVTFTEEYCEWNLRAEHVMPRRRFFLIFARVLCPHDDQLVEAFRRLQLDRNALESYQSNMCRLIDTITE